jgi:hypothetical protein
LTEVVKRVGWDYSQHRERAFLERIMRGLATGLTALAVAASIYFLKDSPVVVFPAMMGFGAVVGVAALEFQKEQKK